MKKNFDLKAYLVIGPENTLNRPVEDIVYSAVEAGFTMIQIRSKTLSARDIIECTRKAAKAIEKSQNTASLIINDRLDIYLAAKDMGIAVDGLHVGQKDIPVETARKYLGNDAILGLSAKSHELIDYVKNADISKIDYFGAGPLHATATKPDAGLQEDGTIETRAFDELTELAKISKIPVVVGGGVKASDLPELKATGVSGFFVVSAVAGAKEPYTAAKELVETWEKS
ncbi:MAG: thiamine phosphate synthase [Selenomonadaceae bacterium]|nr:thiamine phosphate synthase [Selenomonadaceae bacterium]